MLSDGERDIIREAERDARDCEEGMPKYGHHPDPLIDAEVEIDRLSGLLSEAHGGLLRALDYRVATPEGLAIKRDVRSALHRTEYDGPFGARTDF